MNINSLKLLYFSPTQTTKKVIEGIASGIQAQTVDHVDLTAPERNSSDFKSTKEDLVVIGAPVYGGRIPLDAVSRLKQLKGNNSPAILVVVYGNRAFEDALLELKNLAVEIGFQPIAAGAFIGEHSFANDSLPIANGRPDQDDLNKARELGEKVVDKLKVIQETENLSKIEVPGDFPYKSRNDRSGIAPITKDDSCTTCGTCADVCPTGAVSVDDVVSTDVETCILCCACVKNCPSESRVMENEMIQQMAEWLNTNCSEQKMPELWL